MHEAYGGVVPEFASRAHQQNIVPVVTEALRQAGVCKEDLSAVAYTRGRDCSVLCMWAPLLRKEWRWDSTIPLLDVNHLHGHLLSHFIRETENQEVPEFPFIALLVSGGNHRLCL